MEAPDTTRARDAMIVMLCEADLDFETAKYVADAVVDSANEACAAFAEMMSPTFTAARAVADADPSQPVPIAVVEGLRDALSELDKLKEIAP